MGEEPKIPAVIESPEPKPERDARTGRFLPGARPPSPGRRWPKGTSGNPSGLPQAIARVRELAAERSPRAIEVLAELMDDPDEAGPTRVAAACALLDRAGAKPIAVEGERIEITTPVDVEQLRAQIAQRLLRIATATTSTAVELPPAAALPQEPAALPQTAEVIQ